MLPGHWDIRKACDWQLSDYGLVSNCVEYASTRLLADLLINPMKYLPAISAHSAVPLLNYVTELQGRVMQGQKW